MDVDGTLCRLRQPHQNYSEVEPDLLVLARLREYRAAGWYVILYTSRQMRTHDGNLGRINAETAPILMDWLRHHEVPFDELHLGKPWPGDEGFYVDDRAIRPDEFVKLTKEEVEHLLEQDRL
jgi:capsule biosynthesis phosphatase